MRVPLLGWEDPLEEGMATHSSILAWSIPRTEEPGGLQSMGSQRVCMDQRIDIARSRTHAHAQQVLAVAPSRRIFLCGSLAVRCSAWASLVVLQTLECADSVVVVHWA